MSQKVKARLTFSKYIIDPNRFTFSKVVRVVALVIKVVKLFLLKIGKPLLQFSYDITVDDSIHTNNTILEKINMKHDTSVLSDSELQYGLDYFFMKTTEEVKRFCKSETL